MLGMDAETTGAWTEVTCEEMNNSTGAFLVYIGDPELLKEGGKYSHFTKYAAMDR